MDYASYFIKDKALFGSYPTQERVAELESLGVRIFIDLTCHNEKHIKQYTTQYIYNRYPIIDHNIPKNRYTFTCFVIEVANMIESLPPGFLLYLHCKGGHGRSGIVVACLLSYIFNMSSHASLRMTNQLHNNRKIMREKWRYIGSPQTKFQKMFVSKFFSPLYFSHYTDSKFTAGFSTCSPHQVIIPDFGIFHTAEAAIQAYKSPNDRKYVQTQENTECPFTTRHNSKVIDTRSDWKDVYHKIILIVLKYKFDQHTNLKNNLINTGLRPIYQIHSTSSFEEVNNTIGKCLVKLRKIYYSENKLFS